MLMPRALLALVLVLPAAALAQDTPAPLDGAAPAAADEAPSESAAPDEVLPPPPVVVTDQPPKEVDGQPTPEALAEAAARQAEGDREPAWALYFEADAAYRSGDAAEGRRKAEQVQKWFPDHPAAVMAARLIESPPLARVTEEAPAEVAPAAKAMKVTNPKELEAKLLAEEVPSKLARAELVSYQTLHGIGLGIETCFLVQCGNAQVGAVVLLLGGGAGLGLSLGLTGGGVTPVQANAMNTGATWGFWNGMALLGEFDFFDSTASVALPMALQLTGAGAGLLLSQNLEIHAGQVSFSSSIGLWSAILGLLAHGMLEVTPSFAVLMALSDVGFIAGAVASSYFPMSRSRVLMLDIGALLGGLTAGALIVIASPDSAQVAAGVAAAGLIGGWVVAALLTDEWDYDEVEAPAVSVGIAPLEDGAALVFGGRF